MKRTTENKMAEIFSVILLVFMFLCIPVLPLAAWWFNVPMLYFGLAVPLIFFMAG